LNHFVAMLRGINVSGVNKVRMADLARLCEGLGLGEVKTYLASGNVVFGTDRADGNAIASELEERIQQELGLDVRVLVRDGAYLQRVIAENPFLKSDGAGTARLYATFLIEAADADKLFKLEVPAGETATFEARGDVIYLFCPDGYGRTKLSNNFFERKLGVAATTRNWNTVCALAEMAELGSFTFRMR